MEDLPARLAAAQKRRDASAAALAACRQEIAALDAAGRASSLEDERSRCFSENRNAAVENGSALVADFDRQFEREVRRLTPTIDAAIAAAAVKAVLP